MKIVSRPALIPFLALILVPAVFCTPAAHRVQAGDAPAFLSAAAAPTEQTTPPRTWVDDLERRLTTYFIKKYPAYNFEPYTQELDRVRDAVSRGDRLAAKREMGVFLKMLASRAYGLGNDAAEELHGLAQRVMPAEEFGIVYPGSAPDP